ncbi:MAG TPA: hypothetical protein VME66_06595 [Candidatus Acidoferrales bacterium]|nr:hypothetical protein [Candidatus Acidoferrales bacterium]
MRDLQRLDLSPYLAAFAVYARNPVVALAPLAAALAQVLLSQVFGAMMFSSLIAYLIQGFGIGVAIITADLAWRRGRSVFDTAWTEAQRKAPDLLMATLGFGFVMFAAGLIGGMLGSVGVVLQLLAFGFLIYTLPASAIGGIPGGAALQVSVERARANPATTVVLAIVSLAVYIGVTVFAAESITMQVVLMTGSAIAGTVALAFLQALAFGYIAIVLAKVYADISYGRRY